MASCTQIYMTRDRIKRKKMGRKRKAKMVKKGTTPSRAVFFKDE